MAAEETGESERGGLIPLPSLISVKLGSGEDGREGRVTEPERGNRISAEKEGAVSRVKSNLLFTSTEHNVTRIIARVPRASPRAASTQRGMERREGRGSFDGFSRGLISAFT